jgi:plasmid stability protein
MPNLSIKDVPEAWTEALRRRAARNHRSLQGELMAIVEQSLAQENLPVGTEPTQAGATARGPQIVGFDRHGWPIVRQGWRQPEEVIAELRARYPEPIRGQISSIDIIREDRDSR